MKDREPRIEDRGSRIEDRGSRVENGSFTIFDLRSAVFHLRFSAVFALFVSSWLIFGNSLSLAQNRPVLRRATRDHLAGKFVLITGDERPQGLAEPRMLARVADHDLITPPARAMTDAEALIDWAKGIDYAGASGVIVSLDAIQGGSTQREPPDLLKWIRARRPSMPIYAFLHGSSDQAGQSPLAVPEALDLAANAALDFLLISGEAAAQSNLSEEIASRKIESKVAIEPGAGAPAMTLFSRLLNNRFGFAPKIFPVFSSVEAEASRLRQGVNLRIRNAGGVVHGSTTDARGADVLLFVHAPGTAGATRVSFIDAISRAIESGVKVAVADVSETKESKDDLIGWLRRLKLLDKLIAYSSSDPGPQSGESEGAIIRVVAQASTFLNAIRFMRDDADRVLRFDRAQFELLFSRYLTDWAYVLTIRPALDEFVKSELKADPGRLETAAERAEAFAFERVKQTAEELFKEQFRRNVHAILLSGGERARFQISMIQRLLVRFPTLKTSEVEIRQSVYLAQISFPELSTVAGRARWFLENDEVDERIAQRFVSTNWGRFKTDVAEVDINIKWSSKENRHGTAESYAISSSRKGEVRRITITAPSNQGVFYALSKLEALGADGRLAENFQVSESPAIARRGVAEAFSGSPWSQGDRLETLRFLGVARMNRYVYAPKDEDWRQDYTDQDLERFSRLLSVSEENFVRFVYAVRPGSSIRYSSEEDAAAIIRKLETMAALGVTGFALCFDDASTSLQNDEDRARFRSLAAAQAYLINLVYGRLKRSGADIELYVTPSVPAGDYIKELGATIPPDVLLFPWDNFAADLFIGAKKSDSEMSNENADGFIAAAAREPRASMLPIVTAADYAWDRRNYNPQQSFDRALNLLYDEHARAAMRVWARVYGENSFKQSLAELQRATETIGVTLNQGLLRGELTRFIEKMKQDR